MERIAYQFYLFLTGTLMILPLLADKVENNERQLLVKEAHTILEDIRLSRDPRRLDSFQDKLIRIDMSSRREKKEKMLNIPSIGFFTDATELRLAALPIIDSLRDKNFNVKHPPESYMTSWFIPDNLPTTIANQHLRDMEENAQRHEKLVREKKLYDLYESYKGRVSGAIYQAFKASNKTNSDSVDDFVRLTNHVNSVITNTMVREELYSPIKNENNKKGSSR